MKSVNKISNLKTQFVASNVFHPASGNENQTGISHRNDDMLQHRNALDVPTMWTALILSQSALGTC